jgi:hypothetical protein
MKWESISYMSIKWEFPPNKYQATMILYNCHTNHMYKYFNDFLDFKISDNRNLYNKAITVKIIITVYITFLRSVFNHMSRGKFSFDWHIWNWLSFHLNSFNLWMQNLSQVYLYSNISGNAKITKILLSFWRET